MMTSALNLTAIADEPLATVRFSNKDQLTGSLSALTTEQLTWDSPIFENPTSFFLKNVVDLTLFAKLTEVTAKHEALVTLTNGDLIRGQLVTVSDMMVELDTWFAGRMKLNRLMIASINISERPNYVYCGPTSLDGWKQAGDTPAWAYHHLSFRSLGVGSIAREVDLPDECVIAFDVTWRESLAFSFVLLSDDTSKERPSSGYELKFQNRTITLIHRKSQKPIGYNTNATSLQENEKARIEVRASTKSGKVCVFVDGELIDIWTDPEVNHGKFGKAIHFASHHVSPIQISKIEVSAWDGEVDQLPVPKGANRPQIAEDEELSNDQAQLLLEKKLSKTGRMELRNGDNLEGEITSITEGIITVKTPFREVQLPVGSLRTVALKAADLERCKLESGDVRGSLPDGSSLVFRLDGVKDDFITGFSQNFGTVDFKISAFSRIEFNIYDPNLEEIR